MAKQCTAKKRVKDSEWFKDNMLLTQAQEAGVVLNEDQQDFLVDRMEENDDCDDLQLHITINFKAEHVDAYDLDCDDEATTSAIFMASLSPAGSLNDDIVAPTYDSDILFKVPHYNTYHETFVLNSDVQETKYIEHIVSNNESYDELTSNSNVISYADCMVTIKNDVTQYVSPPAQDNDMILFIIEQMKSQVQRCNMVNQETKSVNESLTSKLERYKARVKTLEAEHNSKYFLTKREEFLDSEMRRVIVGRNKKVEAFKKQVVSLYLSHINTRNIRDFREREVYREKEEERKDCDFTKKEMRSNTLHFVR
ncbi:hypothetical protein Tco_0236282 [Tanacetum coccineum]